MISSSPLIRKARRSAKAIVGGPALFERLQKLDVLNLMEEAITEEVPPVSKISRLLLADESLVVDLEAMPVRQFIGSAVRAILADEGYEVMESGVRISGDPVFRTGSTYALPDEKSVNDLLTRFISALTIEELQKAKAMVNDALKARRK